MLVGRYPRIGYSDRELSIGILHFSASTWDLNFQYRKPLNGVMRPRDCGGESACWNIALGLGRLGQNRRKQTPNKTRVMARASQLRREEYQQAQKFTEQRTYPQAKMEAILYSIPRDTTSPRHAPNFQDINLPLDSTREWSRERLHMVFVLTGVGGATRAAGYQFGPTNSSLTLSESANLDVWR